jgi:hypothetical protein
MKFATGEPFATPSGAYAAGRLIISSEFELPNITRFEWTQKRFAAAHKQNADTRVFAFRAKRELANDVECLLEFSVITGQQSTQQSNRIELPFNQTEPRDRIPLSWTLPSVQYP